MKKDTKTSGSNSKQLKKKKVIYQSSGKINLNYDNKDEYKKDVFRNMENLFKLKEA